MEAGSLGGFGSLDAQGHPGGTGDEKSSNGNGPPSDTPGRGLGRSGETPSPPSHSSAGGLGQGANGASRNVAGTAPGNSAAAPGQTKDASPALTTAPGQLKLKQDQTAATDGAPD
jgi:hypothetical protein